MSPLKKGRAPSARVKNQVKSAAAKKKRTAAKSSAAKPKKRSPVSRQVGAIKRRLQIRTRQGLHARPAALFVQVANRFKSVIRVRRGRREVDGKSIMGLLTLAAARGTHLDVSVKGPDSLEALHALEQVVSRRETPAVVTVVKHHSHGTPTRS